MNILVEDLQHHDALKDADIFYQKAFYDLHAQPAKTAYLGLAKGAPQHIIGAAQLILDSTHARTPIRGTYGGIYLTPQNFSIERAESALTQTEDWLLQQGIKTFEIVLPPFVEGTHTQEWVNILLRHGFQITAPDLNYIIPVSELAFDKIVNYACLKKLKQIATANLTVRELVLAEFEQGHRIICENRERKGRRFSMDWSSIQKMQQAFPEAFRMMGAFEGELLRAAGIFIQINAKTIYVFAWGDDGVLSQLTPTTLLAKHLYEYCQQHNFKWLDLGISTEAGIPNLGLINYKLSLGAQASLKLTMKKEYDK